MPSISNRRVFGIALAVGVSLVLASAAHARWQRPAPVKANQLTEQIAISEQVQPDQVAELRARGYTAIIALRPDGEAPDQPSAAQVGAAARSSGMAFSYVPVTPGGISDSAVDALQKALAAQPGPVLLYCRSGKRAARTWGLAEASRSGGADVEAILAAVKASGQSADDLREQLAERVGLRQIAPKAAL